MHGLGITVQLAEPQELSEVKNLFCAVFEETFCKSPPAFEEVTRGEKIYVAKQNNTLLGFASVWEEDCFVHFLFVSAKHRHLGVASAIVNALQNQYGHLFLKCLLSNTNALAFYKANGWHPVECGKSEDGEFVILERLSGNVR